MSSACWVKISKLIRSLPRTTNGLIYNHTYLLNLPRSTNPSSIALSPKKHLSIRSRKLQAKWINHYLTVSFRMAWGIHQRMISKRSWLILIWIAWRLETTKSKWWRNLSLMLRPQQPSSTKWNLRDIMIWSIKMRTTILLPSLNEHLLSSMRDLSALRQEAKKEKERTITCCLKSLIRVLGRRIATIRLQGKNSGTIWATFC